MDTRQTTRAVMAAFVAALMASPGFAQNPQSSTMGQQRPNDGVGSSARMPATTGTGAAQGQTDPGANLGAAPGSAGTPGGMGTAGASSTGQTTTNRALQEQGRGGPAAVPNPAGPAGSTATGGQPAALQGTGGTPGTVGEQRATTQGSGSTSPSAMGVTSGGDRRMGQSSGRQGISDGGPGTQAASPTQGVGAAPSGAGMMQPQGSAGQSGVGPSGTNQAAGGTVQRGGQNTGSVVPGRDANPRDANAPVPGANSFTEGQARGRAEARGFTEVGEMTKDDNGIWRGRAMQNGRSVEVLVDFQGNVTAR